MINMMAGPAEGGKDRRTTLGLASLIETLLAQGHHVEAHLPIDQHSPTIFVDEDIAGAHIVVEDGGVLVRHGMCYMRL